jgi:hypothetical protein
VQRDERTFSFYFKNVAKKTRNNNRDAYRDSVPQTKLTTHKDRWEKVLPKYGSQSETTIDGCP